MKLITPSYKIGGFKRPSISPVNFMGNIIPPTITYIGGGGANGETTTPTGVEVGDLIIGVALKAASTAPTHDTTGGTLILSASSSASSVIAFWDYADSTTPNFGTHTGANRCEWFAYRFSDPPVNPIGASARISGVSSTTFGWAGLTLIKTRSIVVTVGYRAANETIVNRPLAVAAGGATGVSARYKPMRSNGEVLSWPLENVTQTVAGTSQSIAIEIGY